MLIISLNLDEVMYIGNVEIKITRIDGDTVRLGFSGPRDARILREELLERRPRHG